jgi:hypothetical protein
MNHLVQWVQSITGISPVTQERIYASILIIVFLWLVHNLIIMLRFRYTKDINIRYRWKKTTGHMAVLLGMIISRMGMAKGDQTYNCIFRAVFRWYCNGIERSYREYCRLDFYCLAEAFWGG